MKDEFVNIDFLNYLMNFCYKDCKEIYKDSSLKQILLSDSKNIESIFSHVKEISNKKEYYVEIIWLYNFFLFSYDENIIDLFKSLGISEDCISKRDFIDLRELHNWYGNLFESGMYFQVNALLNWIKAELTFRVFKKINERYKLSGELREYEKDRLVNQEEIELDNLRKRFKYCQKENIRPKDDFESELYQSISQLKNLFENSGDPSIESIDLLAEAKRQLKYRPINENANNKFLHVSPEFGIKCVLETVKEVSSYIHTKPFNSNQIKLAFKPLFHKVYEDNVDGLFTEKSFDCYNEGRVGDTEIFDGVYMKYVSSPYISAIIN